MLNYCQLTPSPPSPDISVCARLGDSTRLHCVATGAFKHIQHIASGMEWAGHKGDGEGLLFAVICSHPSSATSRQCTVVAAARPKDYTQGLIRIYRLRRGGESINSLPSCPLSSPLVFPPAYDGELGSVHALSRQWAGCKNGALRGLFHPACHSSQCWGCIECHWEGQWRTK